MKKKFFVYVLSFILLLSLALPASASNDGITKKQLEKLAQKYNLEVTSISEGAETLKVNSIEEVDEFIRTFKENVDKANKERVALKKKKFKSLAASNAKQIDINSNNLMFSARASTTHKDSHKMTQWTPAPALVGEGVLIWTDIIVEFSYEYLNGDTAYPIFKSVDKVTSKEWGLNYVSWDQSTYSLDYSATCAVNDTLDVSVDGYFTAGISVNGQNVGLTWPDTLEDSFYLYDVL